MNKYSLFVFSFLFLLTSFQVQSQDTAIERKMEKVKSLLMKNKIPKAEEKLIALLQDNPDYGPGWEILTNIKNHYYEESKKVGIGTVTVESDDEVDEETQKMMDELAAMLNNMNTSEDDWENYINSLREATLNSSESYSSSIQIRNHFLADTADYEISEKAAQYYMEGEAYFQQKKYEEAIILYKDALKECPEHYKAKLYLGDAYYFMGKFDKAIKYFEEVKEAYPDELAPSKFLVDAYWRNGEAEKSMKEAIHSFLIYPDLSMNAKLRDAAKGAGKTYQQLWMARGSFPNTMQNEELKYILEGRYGKSPWDVYTDAKKDVAEYCDEDGIIVKENKLTESSYLEIYSWEKMLEKTKSSEFKMAKEMQEKGYLDCYVFISCFHNDIHAQYKHFVKENEEKILAYFDLLLE